MSKQPSCPTELTDFIPESIATISLPTWKIVDNESDGTIEIVRNSFFNSATLFITLGLMLFCFLVGTLGHVFAKDLPPQVSFFGVWVVGVGGSIFFLVMIPLLSTFGIWINSRSWPDKVRFRFNKNTGEIVLPRENARYFRNECQELVLGYTTGYDTTLWWRGPGGVICRPAIQNTRAPVTCLYLLVKKDDRWIRHLLAYDRVNTLAKRAIQILPPTLCCEVSTRFIESRECFEMQHPEEDRKNPMKKDETSKNEAINVPSSSRIRIEKSIRVLLTVFFIIGISVLGYGLSMLINGYATSTWPTTEATIIQCKIEHKRVKSNSNRGMTNVFMPKIEYNYSVDGKGYTGNRIRVVDYSVSHGQSQVILDSYPVDSTVQVYYSPTEPEKSVLVPGIPHSSYLVCSIGLFFMIISSGVYLLSRKKVP